ncbi:MAG: pyridoxine 5'-phosphate synthase [Acidobacteriota bacterium]|jgi:pyridoxine 5-phosphate synthase|nr:pyridoxine 5'-phosphate synthase [Acidobacteriota bacterium]
MTKLGVNIDHIATIRQARRALEPDPVAAAILAELAGADGITVHLRGDRRHIQDADVLRLRETVTTRLNMEMAATAEMVRIACELRPDQATLVPESPSEITTEGGLDVVGHMESIREATRALSAKGIQVSLFIDPDPKQIDAAANSGASMIELCTRAYAEACPKSPDLAGAAFERELTRVVQACERGKKLGLKILAGHGLTYRNVGAISAIPEIEELNIGHNIIARASLVGMERAVREMINRMTNYE